CLWTSTRDFRPDRAGRGKWPSDPASLAGKPASGRGWRRSRPGVRSLRYPLTALTRARSPGGKSCGSPGWNGAVVRGGHRSALRTPVRHRPCLAHHAHALVPVVAGGGAFRRFGPCAPAFAFGSGGGRNRIGHAAAGGCGTVVTKSEADRTAEYRIRSPRGNVG